MPKSPLIVLLLLIPSQTALAQTPPSQRDLTPPKPQLPEPPRPTPQEPPSLEIQPPDPPKAPDIAPFPSTITVTQFRFSGNTVFTDEQLLDILKPYLNRQIGFADLQEAKQIITELYQRNGYITSGAYLPISENQSFDPNNATISIGIIEGTVEEIQILGANHLQSYIRKRLRHDKNDVFNQEQLLEALRLLQVNRLLNSISIEVLPGTGPKATILKVTAVANNPFEVSFGLDNYRSPAVSSFQREVTIGHANVLGFGDRISVGYANTDGSNAFSGQYDFPLNARNGTLSVAYSFIDSTITEEPFNQLDIEGDSAITQVSFRQPLIQRASKTSIEEVALGVIGTRYESENSILGIPFPLSEGADRQGRTELTALRFFQDWSKITSKQAIALRSQFSFGLDVFSPTINPNPPDGRYFAWNVQSRLIRNLPHGLQLRARGQFNLSDRPLLAIEQVSLGGVDSVRGYRQNALLRDNGILGSVELSIPLLNRKKHGLNLIPFVDFGTGWNWERANPPIGAEQNTNTLLSTGLTLTYRFKNNLFARIDWGIPLISLENQGDSFQAGGVTVSLEWQN